jgi:hypothetical protein
MSHVAVGERLVGMGPQVIGHVMAGGGHFIEQAGGLIQQFFQAATPIPIIASRAINPLDPTIAANNWQWNNLTQTYGSGALMAGNAESSAWDQFMDNPRMQNKMEILKELALGTGSAFIGDYQGAAEHGAEAIGKMADGIAKDFGFRGGWGTDVGPVPGRGTCPYPGEGRN